MSTSSSGHWPSAENGTPTSSYGEKDNVFYERVMTYPVAKMVQVMEPGSPLSPRPMSPYQTVMYATEQQSQQPQYIQEIQPPYSPTPYTQGGTIRRYIIQNQEQELQAPFQQGTIRRYYVQNPEPQSPFLKGVNYVPGNNVIYEKTITRLDAPPHTEQVNQEKHIHVTRGVTVNEVQENVQQQRTGSYQSSEHEFVFENTTQNTERKSSNQSFEQQKTEVDFGTDKMDSRYFGELLAELSRKNNDLYSCLLQHVEKIGGRKHLDSTSEQPEDIESVIPKGASELTKQQIRYLLQMRQTSDKSMRLVLSTFNTLREDLGHLQGDMNKLETDKSLLERDLEFKETQVKEYEALLASLRESNRQQQQALKENGLKIRRLEEQILLLKNADADKDYRLKELEFSKRALEQESDNLRLQISETCSSPTIVKETEKISKHYMEMLVSLREEKDKEIQKLRTQISNIQHESSSSEGSSRDFQMRIIELTSSLQRTELLVKKQQEELFRLRQERESSKGGVTKAIITKKYRNQYPILGLLSDYNATTPIKDTQTIVIERTGEMWKQEYFTTP
ncbi:protein POF1B isoform X2 [Lissotriton helveticus]